MGFVSLVRSFKILLALFCLAALAPACKDFAPKPDPGGDQDAEHLFEVFWHDVNVTYPFFEIDKVDWQQMHDRYLPHVQASQSQDTLFSVMTRMMMPMLDGHASLTWPDKNGLADSSWSNPDNFKYINDFNLSNVVNGYLSPNNRVISRKIVIGEPRNTTGLLYFYIPSFENTGMAAAIDSAVRKKGIGNVRGIILDIRNNGGGLISESEEVAGLFAGASTPFLKERFKNGPRPSDLTPATVKAYDPFRGLRFTDKPVVLLANRYSASASERLRLGLKVLPNTFCIGDTTYGATSPIIERTLPNGWRYVLVGSITTDLDDVLYERVGIAPDLRVTNTITDVRSGRDRVMQAALDRLQ